jgi:hypothetical protein
LLNQIAAARFKETRTKAYLPKRIPVITWARTLPVVATACLVVAFALTGGLNYFKMPQEEAITLADNSQSGEMDNRYMTIQPQSDHILVQPASQLSNNANWTFSKQLARVNRFRGLLNSMVGQRSGAGYVRSMENPFALIMFDAGHRIPVSVIPVPGNSAETRMIREVR